MQLIKSEENSTAIHPAIAGQMALLDRAQKALDTVFTVDEAREIRNQATAIEAYFQQANVARVIQNRAAEIRLRAERRIGELLSSMQPNTGNRFGDNSGSEAGIQPSVMPKYSEMGLPRAQAAKWKRMSTLPEDQFEAYVAESAETGIDLSSAEVERRAERHHRRVHLHVEEDSPPDFDGDLVFQTGDLVEIEEHRIIVGDSSDVAVRDRLFDGCRPDVLHADPPYGIDLMGKSARRLGGNGNVYKPVLGDDVPFNPSAWRGLADVEIWWGANHYAHHLPGSACWLVWDKERSIDVSFAAAELAAISQGVPLDCNHEFCELAWTSLGRPAAMIRHRWDGFNRASELGVKRVHPNQKPIAVIVWALNFTPGTSVFEPFLGSGTTILACDQLKRRCYAAELDPYYVQCAVLRYQQHRSQTQATKFKLNGTWTTINKLKRALRARG